MSNSLVPKQLLGIRYQTGIFPMNFEVPGKESDGGWYNHIFGVYNRKQSIKFWGVCQETRLTRMKKFKCSILKSYTILFF